MGILDTQIGRDIMTNLVACFLSRRRMSRRLKRSFMIAFDAWKSTGIFNLETLLNNLNSVDQTEIMKLNELMVQLGCSTLGVYNGGIYHVDSVNGSDETGDGSDSRPFATFAFLENGSFPKSISRNISIVVSGSVAADELVFHQDLEPGGSISIVGADDRTVVVTSQGSGPFTLTAVTQIGVPPVYNDLRVVDTFGVDELYGKWIHFKTGACAGQAIPIHKNDASDLYTRNGLDGVPAIGDTFEVIEPTATIVCPRWDLNVRGGTYGNDNSESRFNIFNINVDIRGTTKRDNFRLRNSCSTTMSFVTFISTSNQYEHLWVESDLNNSPPQDAGAYLSGDSTITNQNKPTSFDCAGLLIYRDNFPPITYGFDEIKIGRHATVHAFDCGGRATVISSIEQINVCAAGTFKWENGACGGLFLSFIDGDATGPAIDVQHGGSVLIKNNYLKAGLDAFEIDIGMVNVLANIHGTFTGYGFRFGQEIGYVATSQDPSAWAGGTGAIYFAGGVGATAFPAIDTRVTDAISNFFARIETA